MSQLLNKQIGRFLIVGGTTVLIDFCSYSLYLYAGLELPLAKALGFISGTIFAYLANRFFTFSTPGQAPYRLIPFVLLYAGTLGLNVGINSATIGLLGNGSFGHGFAFLLATAVSATLNFIGMKFFVFQPGTRMEVAS